MSTMLMYWSRAAAEYSARSPGRLFPRPRTRRFPRCQSRWRRPNAHGRAVAVSNDHRLVLLAGLSWSLSPIVQDWPGRRSCLWPGSRWRWSSVVRRDLETHIVGGQGAGVAARTAGRCPPLMLTGPTPGVAKSSAPRSRPVLRLSAGGTSRRQWRESNRRVGGIRLAVDRRKTGRFGWKKSHVAA